MILWWIMSYGGVWHKKKLRVVCSNRRICVEEGMRVYVCVCVCVCVWVHTQRCPTLCEPMDYSLPGSSVYGILQARILEWVAVPFSRESPYPRDRTSVSCIGGWIFYHWHTWDVLKKGGPIYWGKWFSDNILPLDLQLITLKHSLHCIS